MYSIEVLEILYSQYTKALTFQNLRASPRHAAGLEYRVHWSNHYAMVYSLYKITVRVRFQNVLLRHLLRPLEEENEAVDRRQARKLCRICTYTCPRARGRERGCERKGASDPTRQHARGTGTRENAYRVRGAHARGRFGVEV